MSFRDRFALWAVAALVAGCGYAVVSAPSGSGEHSVAVPLFDNRTFEPFLDARVTERVKARLVSSGSWRVVNQPDRAALVIRGAITAFSVTPVSFDANNRPLEQRVMITAEINATSIETAPRPFTLTGTAEYTESSDSLETRAAKNRAVDEAGDFLAQELVARLHTRRLDRSATP